MSTPWRTRDSTYRVVKVTHPKTGIYYTVQIEDGSPWGPVGATLEIIGNGLTLQSAQRTRDFLGRV